MLTIPAVPRPTFDLNDESYYTVEADREFMSCHQLISWRKCAAREFCRQNGTFVPEEDEDALLVGNYVHACLLEPEKKGEFLQDHGAAMLTKSGTLLAKFQIADQCVARLSRDSDAMLLLQGPGGISEKIVVAYLEGAWWKAKMDRVIPEHRVFVDLKTAKSFDMEWSESSKARVQWWRIFNYEAQMALYQKLLAAEEEQQGKPEGHLWLPIIVGVTKQKDGSDIGGVEFTDPLTLSMGYSAAVSGLQEALEIKAGKMPPWRCEHCDYCRATKELRNHIVKA